MNSMRFVSATTCWLAMATCCLGGAVEKLEPGTFRGTVAPFFKRHCYKCHGEKKQEGKLNLHTIAGESKFAADAARWKSILKMLATGEMPPADEQQPKKQLRAKIIAWIKRELSKAGHVSEWDRKLLYPEYGNYVDHARLFDGSERSAPFTPSRLWKKSPHIFKSMLLRGMGLSRGRYGRVSPHLSKVKQPFTMEDKAGIKDFAAIMYADSATLGTLLRNAGAIVDKHLAGAMHELYVKQHGPIPDSQLPKDKRGRPIRPRHPKTANEFKAIIFSKNQPTDQQIDAAVRKMFDLTIERTPTKADLAKYRKLMRQCVGQGGNAEGLRVVLTAVAISPQAIYRIELGQGAVDSHGRRMLSPANLAYAIAYALTDQRPDKVLLEAAKSGRLRTRADVAREVTRLWDDRSIAKPRVLRFFREFFGYHNAPKVFKDAARFGKDYRNVAQLLVDDADLLVQHIVQGDEDVLAKLLTTDKYIVAHSGDNGEMAKKVAALKRFYDYFKDKPWKKFPYQTPKEHAQYARSIDRMFAHPNGNVVKRWMKYLTKCDKNGLTPIPRNKSLAYLTAYNLNENSFSFPVQQPFVLDKGKRAGMLMHPAWLIAHSLNLDNDPVRRGKWIRERLLADTVPELPITVDARIPDAPDQSLRERFRVTRQQQCWRCHRKMNTLGMPFELYDDFGRFRKVEKLHARGRSKPVNSTGVLDGTGDPALDGPVGDPIELMRRLAKSSRVRQSFVRHAFRYWMGRNEMLSDSATLIAADQAYVKNGGSFRALVISLLTSDSFLYRKSIESEPDD